MGYLLAVLCIAIMILCLFLLVFGLPGNWIILGIAFLWAFFSSASFGAQFYLLMIALALLGEIIDFAAGYYGGKRFGGTNQGSIGGIIGALVGGIALAPLFFGLGALLGTLLGGFIGSYLAEIRSGMEAGRAIKAAFGTMLGRFGGFLFKLGIGIALVVISASRIWRSLSVSQPVEDILALLPLLPGCL